MAPGVWRSFRHGLSRLCAARCRFGVRMAMMIGCGLLSFSAHAQFRPALEIYIEKPGAEKSECGLADSPLHSVATLTLENNGVRVVPESNILLYVQPTVLQQGRTCFVNLEVSVRARHPVDAVGAFKPRGGWGAILLCSATVAGMADQDDMRQDFLNQLVQQIKICLEAMEY